MKLMPYVIQEGRLDVLMVPSDLKLYESMKVHVALCVFAYLM